MKHYTYGSRVSCRKYTRYIYSGKIPSTRFRIINPILTTADNHYYLAICMSSKNYIFDKLFFDKNNIDELCFEKNKDKFRKYVMNYGVIICDIDIHNFSIKNKLKKLNKL